MKGQLLVGGDQQLTRFEPHVVRPADDTSDADRVVFDKIVAGQAMRMSFSGMFTP